MDILSELTSSDLFFTHFGNVYKYTPEKGWCYWDGKRYQFNTNGREISDLISLSKIFRDQLPLLGSKEKEEKAQLRAWIKTIESLRHAKNVIELCQTQERFKEDVLSFDADDLLGNFNNTGVRLSDGALVPHNRANKCSKLIKIDYDPEARCDLWTQFLEDVTCGDNQLHAFLQRAVGYSLTGSCKHHVMFFLYGNGSNGKSVFVDVLRTLFGDYGDSTSTDLITLRKDGSGAESSAVARLVGARLVVGSEIQHGARLNEAKVKEMTGEDIVTARFLYKETFAFKPKMKLWITTNAKPIIRGTDNGIWRKLICIPFLAYFSEEKKDTELKAKLLKELPGILAWAVRGAVEWYNIGLKPPPITIEAHKDYRDSMDIIGAFLSENCNQGKDLEESSTLLFKRYEEWCEAEGEKSWSHRNFSIALKDRGIYIPKSGTGHKVVKGYALKEKVMPEASGYPPYLKRIY